MVNPDDSAAIWGSSELRNGHAGDPTHGFYAFT